MYTTVHFNIMITNLSIFPRKLVLKQFQGRVEVISFPSTVPFRFNMHCGIVVRIQYYYRDGLQPNSCFLDLEPKVYGLWRDGASEMPFVRKDLANAAFCFSHFAFCILKFCLRKSMVTFLSIVKHKIQNFFPPKEFHSDSWRKRMNTLKRRIFKIFKPPLKQKRNYLRTT